MKFKKPDTAYWNNKFAAYMHDPFDKVFDIKGHEDRSKEIIDIIAPNISLSDEFWKAADSIAAGFERGLVPGYNKDQNKSGAVDFISNPIITHPVSKNNSLIVNLPFKNYKGDIFDKLKESMQETIGIKAGSGGYSDSFKGDHDKFAIARFFYTHLALRFKLAEDNILDIGGLWHRLPADSRFPDHTIWQHNALTSALYSSMELAKNQDNIGLMVFSITPVQSFISKARKLRDYWIGSIMLSWLAFEGIKWVMENLGPDHILYPSLIDQPLVNEYLLRKYYINNVNSMTKERGIASLPNKFLFLMPFNFAKEIGSEITNAISTNWTAISELTYEKLLEMNVLKPTDDEKKYIESIFKRQFSNFWDLEWSACKLLGENDKNDIQKLLPKNTYERQFSFLNKSLQLLKNKNINYIKSDTGILYSTSHSLVQSALAAQKTKKTVEREEEPGEKCQLCGEFEVLHKETCSNSASNYKSNVKNLWDKINKSWENEVDFKENERLCSICFTKRILHKALNGKDHILSKTFEKVEGYPSTTEMALYNFYKRNNIEDERMKKEIAQNIHKNEVFKGNYANKLKSRDRYFAILLMDGDNMGKLINGETIESTWRTIMHPEIVEKLANNKLDADYCDYWKKHLDGKRLITPAIHAAISEALGDFSIYGAAKIVEKYGGKLIYAGGDDVCAIMSVDNVLDTACEIQQYYCSTFKHISNNTITDISSEWQPKAGKLSINLGKDISISAGILLCHHKESLKEMIQRAHNLLDNKAKKEGGRNACAIELKKRSGGSRYFVRKWNDPDVWETFNDIGQSMKGKEKVKISTSIAYRLAQFKDGIDSIINMDKGEDSISLLQKFIKNQLQKSEVSKQGDIEQLAKKIVTICFDENKRLFNFDALIIAGFMSDIDNQED